MDLSVVICTRDRPELLRRAVAAIADQQHDGVIETIVVFDHSEPDSTLEVLSGSRPVAVMANDRTPGLPGGRNSGLHRARGDLVAFCDDDDVWFPTKVTAQVARFGADPALEVAVTGIRVHRDDHAVDRVLDRDALTFDDLLASRVMEAHPSTYMVRRDALTQGIGDFDEAIPGGYAEDYEWLLHAARRAPIGVVRQPLVRVDWHPKSFFAEQWQTIADALDYLLAAYPEFQRSRVGEARIRGQRAFAFAALGRRSDAIDEIRRTLRLRPAEPRAYLAWLVARRIVTADRVVRTLNRCGRGI